MIIEDLRLLLPFCPKLEQTPRVDVFKCLEDKSDDGDLVNPKLRLTETGTLITKS